MLEAGIKRRKQANVVSIKKCHFGRRKKFKISQSWRLLRNDRVSL